MELLEQLGIKPLSLLAQIVNFGLLLLILWRFLYKPLLKALRDRRDRIEKSLKDAKQIEQELTDTRAKAAEIVSSANVKAENVIKSVEREAEIKRTDKLRTAEAEASQIFKRAEEGLKTERETMRREVQAETMELVAKATERVVEGGMDPKLQNKLIDQAIKELS